MNIFANLRLTLIINTLFVLLAAAVLNSFLNYKHYTLESNGKWQSTKTQLKGVNGVYANMFTKNALWKNRLNIASWFGYQELIYRQPLNAATVQFKYQSAATTPFSFILHKNDTATYGIYFNYNTDSACCLFIADKEGKFTYRSIFYMPPSTPWKWNEATVKRNSDSLTLTVNGHIYINTLFKTPDSIRFGFRGDRNYVFVDDVAAYNKDGIKLMSENFSPPLVFENYTLAFILLSIAACALLFYPAMRSSVTAFNMSVLIGFCAMYWLYFNLLSDRYISNVDYINWHGKKVTFDFDDVVRARVHAQYPLTDTKPVIMFIGSSQTWGAGKTALQNAYPAVVQNNLQTYFSDTSITCINTGICGATSPVLYRYYTTEWYKHRPLLTVIDLSNNDKDTVVFKQYLRQFLQFNQAQNIKTLLIAEPDDYINDSLRVNHTNMATTGNSFGVKTIPIQSYLDTLKPTGFIWWDHVHMTDYGYRLFANHITPQIIKTLEQDSSTLKANKLSLIMHL